MNQMTVCTKKEVTTEEALQSFITEVFEAIVQTFRFTEDEKADFLGNQVAQLVAAIPFVAECEDAKRTALAHLAIYFTELRGGSVIGAHSKSDNFTIYERLRLLSSFKGGNQKVIHHGMTILSLIMLEGYKKSSKQDADNSEYNPLNDGSWDYVALKTSLKNDITQNPCKDLDNIILNNGDILRSKW